MKKAGAIATRLGVHADTVRDWADEFEEFFSEGAKRGEGIRRIFTLGDEVVLNTICEMRKRNVEFEEIRARLRSGERIEVLPAINETLPPESALSVYTEMKELRVQLAERDAEIERLRAEVQAERERAERAGQLSQQEIIALNRKVAVLEFQLEQLLDKEDDDE